MGHLVNPVSFRLGVSRYWNSRWIAHNTYKYNFMFKSDWNIFKFLVRLFSREELVSLGLVFSHVIFIRSSTCFYSIIYFWDGKTLQNLNDNLKKLLFKFSRYKLLTKFFVVLNFFSKYYKLKFFFKKYTYIFFWVLKRKLIYIKFLFQFFIYTFLLKILPLFFKHGLSWDSFFVYFKQNLLKIFFKAELKNLFKQLCYFFSFFNLYRIFLLKMNCFFSNFLNNFIFLDYVYRNLSFFFNKGRSNFLSIYSTLNYFIKKFASNIFLNGSNFKILLRPMSKLDINSAFIARYLAIRMQQRYRLMQALSPVFNDLRKSPLVNGYRIACSGRFTKKEIATYEWYRFGGVPTNTLSAHLDYCAIPFVLKYSMCSFKVWINKKQKDKNYNIEEFRNALLDVLTPYKFFVGNIPFVPLKGFSDLSLSFFAQNLRKNKKFFLRNFLKFRVLTKDASDASILRGNFKKFSLFFDKLRKIGKKIRIKDKKTITSLYNMKKSNLKWLLSIKLLGKKQTVFKL